MAALSVLFDSLQLNETSLSTGYFCQEPIDWGGRAIQDIINSGSFRIEDLDGLLAAARVTRTISLPLRLAGSSSDDLDSKISALNYKLAKASRLAPLDCVVTPNGSTKTTTFKVIGGAMDTPGGYDRRSDLLHLAHVDLLLEALPFGYGAKQSGGTGFGTSGSPLVNAAGPAAFTVTIPAGSEGDVLADVSVIFSSTSALGAVACGCIPGNAAWTNWQDLTSWSQTGGAATYAAVSNAKYKGGAAPGVTNLAANAGASTLFKTFTTSDFPTNTPIRVIIFADDVTTTAGLRGLNQFRLIATVGGVTTYGEWVSVPANAFSGTNHYLQGVDMGVFTFPPHAVPQSVAYSGTVTLTIQQQTSNATPTQLVYDSILFLPDSSSVIAETFGSLNSIAANTQMRIENDLVYKDSTGESWSLSMTGPHLRCRGTSEYVIWTTSAAGLGYGGADIDYTTVKAWVEYTPRYINLAPV